MARLIKISTIYVLFFIYIYSVIFKIVPVSSKYFIEIAGLLWLLPYLLSNKYTIKKEYKTIFRYLLLIVGWDIIVCCVNMSFVLYLSKNVLVVVGSLFGAQFIYDFSRHYIKTKEDFLKVILNIVLIQCLIAVVIKYIPLAYGIADAIQVFQLGEAETGDFLDYYRFVGVGNAVFFGALVSFAIGFMSVAYLLSDIENPVKKIYYYIVYLFIAVVSFFVVRTSLVLFALSLSFFFIFQSRKTLIKKIESLVLYGVFAYAAFLLISTLLDTRMILWALEIFDDPEHGSLGGVREWWSETDFSFKTLLFGDGRYTNPDGSYYMHLDVGIFRKIYYGGLLGLILDLSYHIFILKSIYHYSSDKKTKILLTGLFASYIIILAKGDANMLSYFILYLVFYSNGCFCNKTLKQNEVNKEIIEYDKA